MSIHHIIISLHPLGPKYCWAQFVWTCTIPLLELWAKYDIWGLMEYHIVSIHVSQLDGTSLITSFPRCVIKLNIGSWVECSHSKYVHCMYVWSWYENSFRIVIKTWSCNFVYSLHWNCIFRYSHKFWYHQNKFC